MLGLLLALAIPFLPSAPVVDGRLDRNLERLPDHVFPDSGIHWRIAYGTDFLYLYLDVPKARMENRDRAYQNGDGFHLVLAKPSAEAEGSREFVVLGFSPMAASAARQRAFTWYRNVDLAFRSLEGSQLATATAGSNTGIELVLPWRDVYPFHPWFMDGIGFNLCYVEAIGVGEKKLHFLRPDRRMQSEQSPRLYEPAIFEKPRELKMAQFYATPALNHVQAGSPVDLRVVVAGPDNKVLRAYVVNAQRKVMTAKTTSLPGGFRETRVALGTEGLPSGDYRIEWQATAAWGASGLTILPRTDFEALRRRLSVSLRNLAAGSGATMAYRLQQAERQLKALQTYDTAEDLRSGLTELENLIASAERGQDEIAAARGHLRRAYRSQVDGSLQPYSVRLPADFDHSRKYPLFVYLHGSGEDDRRQLDRSWFPASWIQLAPNGRGTSNCFSADLAQDDIREAIDDVIANYPVDQSRIVLTGFSMGGYGVYRTALEIGSRFRAYGVFSGHPSLAGRFLGEGHPDFLSGADLLRPFQGKPMFVFHGGQDRNCPFDLTVALVEKLKAVGAKVEFIVEPDKGHETASPATLQRFAKWLDSQGN